jgi:hypothetical protein
MVKPAEASNDVDGSVVKHATTSVAMSWRDLAAFALVGGLVIAAALVVGAAAGRFEADPDYIYTLNGLELLTLRSPSYYTHPGTPVEILSALVIALAWLVSLPMHGLVSVQDQLLGHIDYYMRWINAAFIACNAGALVFFAWRVRAATGRLFPSIAGSLSLFLFMSAFLSVHRITAEPFLLTGSIVLAGILAPLAFAPEGFAETRKFAMAVGAAIGFCIAVKATAAPLLIMIFLLTRDRRMTALLSCLVTILILTLPVVPHYPEMLLWYVGLFTHQGGYGSGAVGVPSFADLMADAGSLVAATPEVFVCLALYGVAIVMARVGLWRLPERSIRMLTFCFAFVVLDLLLVVKQPEVRYTIPTVGLLCLGNAVLLQCFLPRAPVWAGMLVVAALAAIGFSTGQARTEHLIAVRAPNEALLRKVAQSGCLESPYYEVNQTEFNLYFGNGWTQSIYSDRLDRLFPDFISYDNNHNVFQNFAGNMTRQQVLALFARQKCVYLVGSPMARFTPSFFPPEWISLVEQTPGTPREAIAVYALKPGWEKSFPQ